ncbi:hypothetical protein [Dyadobacter arcticus]|uniref:Uncharacterized protein n=1 Tax=Dyadobacter arcticus TaxID=1078754 RepID=A0ABX0URF0_9BACT|nr:hypothetical protein [Dyadobacter arcticus]NIJ54185.1 hypothetical protein [Dyadobacter arcticus]
MENGFSGRVIVYKSENSALVLILVRLDDWRKHGSLAELSKCFEEVANQRNVGNKCALLWEDCWSNKQRIVQSRLMFLLGVSQRIPGRLTTARRIDLNIASRFLENNHLNGAITSKFKFGLFLPRRYFRVLQSGFEIDEEAEELLVAAATFSYPRIFQQEGKDYKSYELIRSASLLHTNVVGGLDKLMHAFINDRHPGDIMTYADLEWSGGESYSKLGFEVRGIKQPEPFLLDDETMTRSSRSDGSTNTFPLTKPYTLIYNMGSIKYVKVMDALQ